MYSVCVYIRRPCNSIQYTHATCCRHALALYDWNGDGLQGRQFSSVINRLVCREAEHVHSWVARVESTRECW